ncbi:ArsR family transcriptional regulator [Oricola indica]|uniref:ArsR family transcriptional regulator n=1 Tax=Oricola indica TaxID=2872591 RepID=UPI001CC00C90|nr:ArsR family transcriptional regulator [Oricola indica]
MDKKHLNFRTLQGYLDANLVMLSLKGEINASIINTFLGVALWGGIHDGEEPLTLHELASRIGLSETTVSRHLRYLGDWERQEKPGMGLVKTDTYPRNRRQKVASLTTKGVHLRDQLLAVLPDQRGMTKRRKQGPREIAARALCRMDGHPENIQFEGRPMWASYLPQVDAVLMAALPSDKLASVMAEEQVLKDNEPEDGA